MDPSWKKMKKKEKEAHMIRTYGALLPPMRQMIEDNGISPKSGFDGGDWEDYSVANLTAIYDLFVQSFLSTCRN